MTRPRIYGNETKCRAALARCIERGEELLDQSLGVRKRVDPHKGSNDLASLEYAHFVEQEWSSEFRKWMKQTGTEMIDYLQEQLLDVLPVIYHGLPPPTGKPRHWIGLDNGQPWLEKALEELHALQDTPVEPTGPSGTYSPLAGVSIRRREPVATGSLCVRARRRGQALALPPRRTVSSGACWARRER